MPSDAVLATVNAHGLCICPPQIVQLPVRPEPLGVVETAPEASVDAKPLPEIVIAVPTGPEFGVMTIAGPRTVN